MLSLIFRIAAAMTARVGGVRLVDAMTEDVQTQTATLSSVLEPLGLELLIMETESFDYRNTEKPALRWGD